MKFHPMLFGSLSWRSGRWLAGAALLVIFLLMAGCAETGQMYDQPRYDPLEASNFFPGGQSAQQPIPGTVPYSGPVIPGTLPYYGSTSPNSSALTGLTENGQPLKGWPVQVNKDLVQLGQERFNIFCIPCHGPTGEGNGKATLFGFPKPPDLLGKDAKALSNGDIFQIIQNGKGKMFSYGYRVKPDERWAVISYIRAMQLKNGAVTLQDLTPDLLDQIGKQQ